MTIGLILLLAVSVMIFLGIAHRVLDKLYLNDREALVGVLLILVGGFIDIPVYKGVQTISLNLGGSIFPAIIALYVLIRADSPGETGRGIAASVGTGALLLAITKLFAFDEGRTIIDSIYIFSLIAGVVAYLIGRSRRAAFVGAILGVILLDIAHLIEVVIKGIPSNVHLGGAGAFDAVVIAGIIAVSFTEVLGETIERLEKTQSLNNQDDESDK
ncbi:MAG: DUF1614 domain-containing protein [Firmicutes bacterium]|nr:DUF1614 domain-containing protein [Bacillota bacterium]